MAEKVTSKTKFGDYEIWELEAGPLICMYKGSRMRRSLSDVAVIKALIDELGVARAGIDSTKTAEPVYDNRALSVLTKSELEILIMLHEGLINKQIALHRGVTIQTVKAQVSSIMKKLGVNNRSQILKKTIGIKGYV